MRKTRNKPTSMSLKTAVSRPMLVVRWVANKREKSEIEELRSDRAVDRGIGYVDAQSKADLVNAIERWLGSDNAQVLYIGAHGTPNGLVNGSRSKEQISWRGLGQVLASRRKRLEPIFLMIGACYSGNAAEEWSALNLDVPVSFILAFRDRPLTTDVIRVLAEYVESTSSPKADPNGIPEDLTFVPEDARRLIERFADVDLTLYHKFYEGHVRRYIEPSKFPVALDQYLEHRRSRRQIARLAQDMVEGDREPVRTSDELNKMRREIKRSSKKMLIDDSLPARPLPGREKRLRRGRQLP